MRLGGVKFLIVPSFPHRLNLGHTTSQLESRSWKVSLLYSDFTTMRTPPPPPPEAERSLRWSLWPSGQISGSLIYVFNHVSVPIMTSGFTVNNVVQSTQLWFYWLKVDIKYLQRVSDLCWPLIPRRRWGMYWS